MKMLTIMTHDDDDDDKYITDDTSIWDDALPGTTKSRSSISATI